MGNRASNCKWHHAPEVRRGFWDFEKVSEIETWHRTRRVDFRLLAEALGRCRTRWGADEKRQNRKNVSLSPYVEKPLNSKAIKSFVPEQRSRKCFSCFVIPMFDVIYIYMNIICPFRISASGYGTFELAYSMSPSSSLTTMLFPSRLGLCNTSTPPH